MTTTSTELWKDFVTPLSIPAKRSGSFRIVKKKFRPGTTMETSNARTALIGGQVGGKVTFPVETVRHYLESDEDGLWMSDLPIEIAQHRREVERFGGRVLIGGLGLGLAVRLLCEREDPPPLVPNGPVDHIVVVEKSEDVINLVGKHVAHPKVEIVHEDLFTYLKENTTPYFDFAFYDIWKSDGEHTFHSTVVPLRRNSRCVVNRYDRVVCWNEDVMRGQLYMKLRSTVPLLKNPTMMPEKLRFTVDDVLQTGGLYTDWWMPFFREWDRLKDLPDEDMENAMQQYVGMYERFDGWEAWWIYWLEVEVE